MTAIHATETSSRNAESVATRFKQWTRQNILEFCLIGGGATLLTIAAVFGIGYGV